MFSLSLSLRLFVDFSELNSMNIYTLIKIFRSPVPSISINLRLTYNRLTNDLTQQSIFRSQPVKCRSNSNRSFCSLCHQHRHNMLMQALNREMTNLLTRTRLNLNHLVPNSRLSSSKSDHEGSQSGDNKEQLKFTQTKGQDFKTFEDRGQVIQDIFEKEWNPITYEGLDLDREINEMEEIKKYKKQRGETGIFDLEEIVKVLSYEGARDLAVIKIPEDIEWANYMVCCSMKTPRHMFAIATAIRKICKNKEKKKGEKIPEIEGKEGGSDDWIAMDLGNIILQIFSRDYRKIIDLETLWTVGPEFDDITNMKESEIVQLLNMDFSQYIKLRDEKRAAEAEDLQKNQLENYSKKSDLFNSHT